MRKRTPVRSARPMPRIYGNLQPVQRDFRPFWRTVRAVLGLILSGSLAYALLFSPFARVKTIEVQGAELSDVEVIRQLVPLNEPIWSIPSQSIVQEILATQPVESAVVLRGLPDSVRIILHERTPVALWYSGGAVSLIDKSGIAFLQFPEGAQPAPETAIGQQMQNLPRVYDLHSLPVSVGQSVGGVRFFEFITGVQTAFTQYLPKFTIERMEIAETTYDVTVITNGNLRVAMNSLADPGVQVRNLTRLIAQEGVTEGVIVDLRIDRWAYVRL